MNRIDVPRLIAGLFGLTGFSVAIIAGLAADNQIQVIVSRAIVCLFICFFIGLLVGIFAETVVRDVIDPETIDSDNARAGDAHASEL